MAARPIADNQRTMPLPPDADPIQSAASLPNPLQTHLLQALDKAGGWMGFDAFMDAALYTPGWGYYVNDSLKFGLMPGFKDQPGSDFVTAPEISPHFGRAMARQLAQALEATGTSEVWEFGAGSGALAAQILQALPELQRYTIVDVSGSLRARQHARLQAHADRVQWATELPAALTGVVLGNEVLDAMPVKLLSRLQGVWHERGVARLDSAFVFADQPTALRPAFEVAGAHDYVTEMHPQAEAFVRTLADRLAAGAIFLLDYGFPEHEYYHPQRSMGTVMCHHQHRSDGNPLADVGLKDITAHVNFTGVALAGQDAGLQVLGYTGQGRFLLNCGVLDGLENASAPERAMVQKLVNEHEMGELFKVLAFGAKTSPPWEPMGFSAGDRSHTL